MPLPPRSLPERLFPLRGPPPSPASLALPPGLAAATHHDEKGSPSPPPFPPGRHSLPGAARLRGGTPSARAASAPPAPYVAPGRGGPLRRRRRGETNPKLTRRPERPRAVACSCHQLRAAWQV